MAETSFEGRSNEKPFFKVCVYLTLASESMLAGSAGSFNSTVRVSTAITPIGIPPKRALPVTTVLAQAAMISSQEPWSKNPESQQLLTRIICIKVFKGIIPKKIVLRVSASADRLKDKGQ